jgi:hypothetical protein
MAGRQKNSHKEKLVKSIRSCNQNLLRGGHSFRGYAFKIAENATAFPSGLHSETPAHP